jgi:hypothetical protein
MRTTDGPREHRLNGSAREHRLNGSATTAIPWLFEWADVLKTGAPPGRPPAIASEGKDAQPARLSVPHELSGPVQMLCGALAMPIDVLVRSRLIQLARRALSVMDGYAVGFVVRNSHDLRALSLAHNPALTSDGVFPIAQAIAFCPRLVALDLSDTSMLRRSLMPGDGNPHGLDPRHDWLESRAIAALSNSLGKTVVTDLAVERVGMRKNELHLLASAWASVADGIAPLQLQTLRLGGNALGDDGVAELARSLARVGSLQVLVLDTNRIGCAGAAALAGVLATSPRLRSLSVRANRICAQGTAALARGLALADWLAHLDMGLNPVGVGGDLGTRALADVVASGAATRLERLTFDGSGLGARHGKQLRAAAATRRQLPPDPRFGLRRELDVHGVPGFQ